MQGFGADRTFSATEWRVMLVAGCGVLTIGLGLGVVIGRLTAPEPALPPASARIIPDLPPITVATAGDDDGDDGSATPLPKASAPASAPASQAPAATVAPSAPVAAKPTVSPVVVARGPVPVAVAPRVQHRPIDTRPVDTKPVDTKPVHKLVRANPAAAPTLPIHGPRWIVQLGAFQSADHANLLVNTLAAHGQPAHVSFTRDAAGQGWFYVQTATYRSAAAAKGAAKDLAAQEHLPTYLVKLPADAG